MSSVNEVDAFWEYRRARLFREKGHPGWFRRLRCRIGWHYWWTTYGYRDRIGYAKFKTCPYCQKDGGYVH